MNNSSSLQFIPLVFAMAALLGSHVTAEEQVIMNTHSYWRSHITLRAPAVGTSASDARPAPPETFIGRAHGWRLDSDSPPQDWMNPEFDDSDWNRAPGPLNGGYGFKQPMSHALICLRGRFLVNDPAQAELTLSVAFRGGLVIYLNGREIARKHLPGGALTADSLADIYPFEAYTTPEGKYLHRSVDHRHKERYQLRIRKLAGLVLPPEYLRNGTNVLALQIHRAPVHESFLKVAERWKGAWSHVGMVSLELKAARPGAVVPNVDRPKGIQVWNATPMTAIFDLDYGDPCEVLGPIRIHGAQNGSFCGQVVVSSDQPLKGIQAIMSDLRGSAGTIPASAVDVRYALPGGIENDAAERYGCPHANRFDVLAEAPPAEVPVRTKKRSAFTAGAVQPIWIIVNIPADTPAGDYHGTLAVSADGLKETAVPVLVKVAGWKLPHPRDYVTFVDLIESPESVALRYEVPLWSDRHFALMEKSFKHPGRIGNKTVYIPLICHTHFGNSESMVRYVKQADGSYKGDFSIMEKYLDLAEKYLGKPRVVCLYAWDHMAGGGYFGRAFGRNKPRKVPVSVLDPETQKVTTFESPMYVETAEAKAFWKPSMTELMERMKKRGLEKSVMIGIFSDQRPSKEMVDLWAELLPGVPWVAQSHGHAVSIHGVPVGYSSTVWQAAGATDPDVARTYGWQGRGRKAQIVAEYRRDLVLSCRLTEHRLLAEHNIQGKQSGFGRNGIDFWPALKDKDGKWASTLVNRYSYSNWAQLSIKTCMLSPGPDGALSTIRFEMIREGVQECEARIFIEKALLDKTHRAKLGAEKAKQLQDMLDQRTRAVLWSRNDDDWFLSSGWQDRSARLFAAAAETKAALAH